MTRLSDSQLVILTAACQREDRSVFPITARLSGGALAKVLQSLLTKSLIEEVPADLGDEVWRTAEDDARLTLRATRAAEEALGISETSGPSETLPTEPVPEDLPKKPPAKALRSRTGGKAGDGATQVPAKSDAAPTLPVRAGTKQSALIEMLRRDTGATIEEMVTATGWQAHTVRGAIAGAMKKRLSLKVESGKVEGRGRVYRIAS
jgi:hypothetical protein